MNKLSQIVERVKGRTILCVFSDVSCFENILEDRFKLVTLYPTINDINIIIIIANMCNLSDSETYYFNKKLLQITFYNMTFY